MASYYVKSRVIQFKKWCYKVLERREIQVYYMFKRQELNQGCACLRERPVAVLTTG